MNLIPLYRFLDQNSAPRHAKETLNKLLTCQGICKLSRAAFLADRDFLALEALGLVTWEAGSLVVTEEAYELAGIDPPSTAVEIL